MVEKELKKFLGLSAIALMPFSAQAAVTCTATPDCATLGYTKTASQCPSGGIKCPFNSNLMFCLKNTTAYNFQLKLPTTLYNVVYHDGSTSASYSYNASKTPIGIVAYLYPSNKNKGFILSREQPILGTYAEAIEYCSNYSIKGTNVGDWRLPNLQELIWIGYYTSYNKTNNPYNDINRKLASIRWADPLFYSFNAGKYTVSSSPNVMYSNSSTYGYYSNTYWSTNDYPTDTTKAYYHSFSNTDSIGYDSKTGYNHFRCIMDF